MNINSKGIKVDYKEHFGIKCHSTHYNIAFVLKKKTPNPLQKI